jgi:hypothetical protein
MFMISWARGWVPKHVGYWVLRNRNGPQIIIVQISSRSGYHFSWVFFCTKRSPKIMKFKGS